MFYISCFFVGATLLCIFSTIQKFNIGVQLQIKSYIVPFYFGGITGYVIGILIYKINTKKNQYKYMLKQIKERDFNFHNLFEHLTDAVILHPLNNDKLGNIIDVNNFACEKFGYSREEFLQISVKGLVIPEDVNDDNVKKHYSILFDQGYELFMVTCITKLGSEFIGEINSNKVIIDDKHFIISIIRDVTEKQESENKYNQLVNNLPYMIYKMKIPEGKYTFVNDAVEKHFGYSVEEFCTTPFIIKKIIHPDFKKYFKTEWGKILQGNPSDTYLFKIIDKDGIEKWIEQSNSFEFDNQNKIISMEGIIHDVTSRKIAEDALKALSTSFFRKSGG